MSDEKELLEIEEQIQKLKEKKKAKAKKIKEKKEKELFKRYNSIDGFLAKHFNEMSEKKWDELLKFIVENENEIISRFADSETEKASVKITNNSNYKLPKNVTTEYTINKKQISVEDLEASNRKYNGTC